MTQENFPAINSTYGFRKQYQELLLCHLAHCPELLDSAFTQIQVEDFELPIFKVMWESLQLYYADHKRKPTVQEYYLTIGRVVHNADGKRMSILTPEEYPALEEVMRVVFYPKHELTPDFYQATLPAFIRHTRASKLFTTAQSQLQMGIDTAGVIQQLAKIDQEAASINRTRLFSSLREQSGLRRAGASSMRISTGCAKLDYMLDGGPQPTQLCCITGTPGTGKTNSLTHVGTMGALSGIRTLCVSLELPGEQIKRRHIAMSMAIHGKYLKIPVENWPDTETFRTSMLFSPEYRACDYFMVADMSTKRYAAREVESQIELWKEWHVKTYGTDEDCLLVCVDWLDMLLPPRGMEDKSHDALSQLGHELKFIAKRQNVCLWTATQGTRDADGKSVVRMKHMAGAYHKNDALDLGIGIGRVEDPLTMDAANVEEQGCMIAWTINKNREGRQGVVELFQAPTLRFYDSKEMYQAHLVALENPAILRDAKLMHSVHQAGGRRVLAV